MRRPTLRLDLVAVALGTLAVAAAACADDLVSPPAPPEPQQCRGFEALMPNFVRALSTGKTERLRYVVENYLLKPERDGEPPPVNDVLRAVFMTITGFARQSPEAGAPAGQLCSPVPPPLSQSNGLCELRRALDTLVHEGRGIDALKIVDPQITIAARYLIGQGRDRTPHYEVVNVVTRLCAQDADCQLSNGLDLAIALAQYAETADGRLAFQHLADLGTKGSVTSFLNPASLTEDGMVAIARALITAILGADATALDNLPLPADVMTDLKPVLDDLKKILDPSHRPDIITPLKRSLNCINKKDTNYDLVRMVYRLALRDQCPEFGLTRLSTLLTDLQQVDQRGAFIHLVGTLAQAVRNDEQAIDSAAKVCRTLLSTRRDTNQAQSNAEMVLPVIADLFACGIVNEAICAVDTLVYGCAGGSQPACGSQPVCDGVAVCAAP